MYRFQGTHRSNGIYCEPDNTHHHHFSPPHMTKKMSKMRPHQYHGSRTSSRTASHRNDPGMDSDIDSSSDVSDGTYPDSEGRGMSLQTRMNITQNGGVDSPPEPAPSDLPMRMNGALRTLKSSYGGDLDGDSEHSAYHMQPNSAVFLPQEYHMSSPYQPKPAHQIGTSLATAKKLFQSDNLPNETADSNSTQSTLPSQARLIGGLGPPTSNPMMSGIPSAPVILPVFPHSTPHSGQVTGAGGVVPSSRSLPRNQYSPSRFPLQKDCRVSDRCSWKCVCVALILLCVSLISILIYFAAIMGNCSRYPGTGCIVVEDAKVMARGEKHFPVIDLTSISPKSNEVEMVSPTSLVPDVTSKGYGDFNVAPVEVIWGQALTRRIEPYSYWTLEVNMRESGHVNLNLTVPWGTNWAILLRKNALPSVTQHDLIKIVKNGRMEHRNKRRHVRSVEDEPTEQGIFATSVVREKREAFADPSIIVLSEYLDAGKWFLRLFNDDISQRKVKLVTSVDPATDVRCPLQCSGNGNCVYGKCHCFEGFTGLDCSTSICPVLCSNHGRYGGGICHCESGWKGPECDVPESECEISNCQGNGDCVNGKCVCRKGWTGTFCDSPECAEPTCSQHGTCIQGKCLCHSGWTGQSCNFPESLLAKCIPDCSTRGAFDAESRSCICEKPYGGPECREVVCEKECDRNGFCNDKGQCECQPGWNGDNCELLICDLRCQEHGQCKNGTCICSQGWNGKYCTLAGCPNSCSRHGSCIMQDGVYSCKCNSGWAGLNCSVQIETNCSDDVDNDNDGMTDCSDSECCESSACKGHLMCMTANDPVEVLLRKQPPSVTSSFYQRVKFLIEEESVQSYASKDEYWERRVSVIRGQVLSSDGLGIVGIRVSVDKSQRLGFTLTRKGGWFDMLVNGGGSVTLQFQRAPFRQLTRTVFVPWNEIVVLDPPVIMNVGGAHLRDQSFEESRQSQAPCLQHNLDMLQPTIISSWFPPMVGASPEKTRVFGETQILQESIVIPGSDVHLLYHSSQSPGYLTTVLMQLTGPKVPDGLTLVHLKITIEGELYRRTFEADPNITYTFGWRKRNVYQQKVYGLASARVAVGYEYSNCSKAVWTVQSVILKGFDVDIADVGGWNLDIHHHYNFHEGILQKGDGSEVHLKELPRLVTTLMGRKGQQRPLLCEPCEKLLLSPIALATGPDGSLYVGDFNLIRRITPENRTYTLLQLSATKVSQQYFITVSPADGHLYISDPEKYQILRVNSMEEVEDPGVNWSPVVGSGLKCVPGDPESCGDGFPAKLARLNHPKGLVLTSGGAIYIADGPNIRYVDSYGVIHTLVGRQTHWSTRGDLVRTTDFESCRVMREDAAKVQLHWPTNLALNLVENKLLFIDEGNLFQITEDNQVERVLKCETSGKVVRPILDLAFSPKGQLYFVTEDSSLFTVKAKGQPLMVRTDKVPPYEQLYGGKGASQRNNLDSSSVSALSIGADGTIYVADQANLELKQVSHFIPTPNMNGDYEIVFPATGEMYIFNRYGQHILTKDLKSGKVLYSFLYTKNTSYGKLNKISDSAEHKLVFMRDYNSVVSTIENTQGKKCNLKINHQGRLVHFQVMEHSEVKLEYSDDGLLLAKTTATGLASLYSYDPSGRIRRVIDETGVITSFSYKLNDQSIEVQVYDSSQIGLTRYKIVRSEEIDKVTITQLMTDAPTALSSERVIRTDKTNLSYSLLSEVGGEMTGWCWGIYPLLNKALPTEGTLMRAPSHQFVRDMESPHPGGNKHEWKLRILGESSNPILERQMWVNDSKVLTSEFDHTLSKEVVYNRAKEPIFAIQFDITGLPLYFTPALNLNPMSLSMNISYDRFNRIENWKWGEARGQMITYGRNGFATEIKNSDGGLLRTVVYDEADQPSKIILQSGRTYTFQYDIHGGMKSMETPKNTRHSFTFQHSVGFTKLIYQPPGYGSIKNSFVKYYNSYGLLQSVWLPTESGRVYYEYDFLRRPIYVLYSEGKIRYKYKSRQVTIACTENTKFESVTHIWTNALSKVTLEKLEFGSKSGMSSAKFVYEYDVNFRPVLIKSRVGGNVLPDFSLAYNRETGMLDQLGNFRISNTNNNQSSIFDGVAIFSRLKDFYDQPLQYTLTIQAVEVFRLDYLYDTKSHRIQQLLMTTKSNGFSDQTYAPIKNYTYDVDGQLIMVESVEPWRFEYDPNGNLQTLSYRGNTIPLEYNQQDRIVRFGDGSYKYDNAGRIVQNAREELFMYNSLGHLKRAWKRGQFDVEYFYDSEGRLVARKDSQGNATQFFYGDVRHKNLVTIIYSPKENRLTHYIYDESQRLIFFQVNRAEKYYVASDHCGTPILVFSQYGQIVREMSRSPYGYIIYDSDPTFYLPIDFCGGLFDKSTRLVHTKDGRAYDPLIGQFLMPDWQNVLPHLSTPEKVHLYRLNNNDPMNHIDPAPAFDHQSWLKQLGYNLESLAPQIYPKSIGLSSSTGQLVVSGLESRVNEKVFTESLLLTIPKSVVTKSMLIPDPAALISEIDPPLGKSILLSRTADGKAMISSCPFCTSNQIYRDVFTQILNGSEFLGYAAHSPSQDVFHFAKKELWKASDDLAELKRLGGQVNVAVQDRSSENQMIDLKIHMTGAMLSVKYGLNGSAEESRLTHHAKSIAVQKAWANLKDYIRGGYPVPELTSVEKEEVLKNGHVSSHHPEFTHNPEEFPIFADDPLNVRIVKKTKSQRNRSSPNHQH